MSGLRTHSYGAPRACDGCGEFHRVLYGRGAERLCALCVDKRERLAVEPAVEAGQEDGEALAEEKAPARRRRRVTLEDDLEI